MVVHSVFEINEMFVPFLTIKCLPVCAFPHESVIFAVATFQAADETAWGRLDVRLWNTQQFSKMNQHNLERTFLQNQNQEKTPCITRGNVLWDLGNAQIRLKRRAKKKKNQVQKRVHTHIWFPQLKVFFLYCFIPPSVYQAYTIAGQLPYTMAGTPLVKVHIKVFLSWMKGWRLG